MTDAPEDTDRNARKIHLYRSPLPWRTPEDQLTECGRSPAALEVVDRDTFNQKIKAWGQKRSALLTCMTCYHTACQYGTWDVDPVQAIAREASWARYGPDAGRFRRELLALAALVAAHPHEFAAAVEGLNSTTDLTAFRHAKRRA